ncbi:hypothetical protein [Parasphingorhabdus sp.]|uniref:hypothetical protein n=1 Tax=Parasphingorhabdus sp. TaxID=2709688 RepID=UPI003593561D
MASKYLILVAALPLALSACSKDEEGSSNGSGISIDISDESKPDAEKIRIGGDGEDSKFSIKADGFSMEVDLPSITLDSDNFDMNNIDLYPGSQVTGFDIEDEKGAGGKVQISFKAPAGTDRLADWYQGQLSGKNFEVVRNGTSLSGKTDEGDPFSLALTEISADQSRGVLVFTESK